MKTNKLHTLTFALGSLTLVLATGSSEDVLDYVEDEVPNKRTLVTSGIRKDAKQAMVLHIDAGFDGDMGEAKRSIPAILVKSILNGYNRQDWNFFNLFAYTGKKIDVAVGSPLMAKIRAVQAYAQDFARRVFTKDGAIAGSEDNTRTLMLIGPDDQRYVYAWNYKSGNDVLLAQPFESEMTRYTAVGNVLVALQSGTSIISTVSGPAIANAINGEEINWQQNIALDDAEIDDLSVGHRNADGNYTVIATGIFNGQASIQVLTVLKDDDDNVQILASGSPVDLDEQTARFGAVVRFDQQATIFVNHNGGQDTVTRVRTADLPAPVQQTLQAAA